MMRDIDGKLISTGDVIENIHSMKLYTVTRVTPDGMYLKGGRYIPWFIVNGAWRRLSYSEIYKRRKATR